MYGIQQNSKKKVISSFDTSFLTPEKKNSVEANSEQEISSTKLEEVHNFLYHCVKSYSCIEMMNLTTDSIISVKAFFTEMYPDIPDIILKSEENAIASGEFTVQIRAYLAEEFNIPEEYSFCVICILNFSFLYKIDIVTSGKSLFELSSSRFECSQCVMIDNFENEQEKSLRSRRERNLHALKELQVRSSEDEEDDSEKDEDFHPPDSVKSYDSDIGSDVFEFHDDSDFDIYNPFDQSKSCTEFNLVNSTFRRETVKITLPSDLSPIRRSNNFVCQKCSRNFSKKYNLKLHLVSQHQIFPKGMSIYQCPEKDCSFVSGNLVLFNRHNHLKTAAVGKRLMRLKCTDCNQSFAGKSSLKRHMERKHK
jgi:hypothetical protein